MEKTGGGFGVAERDGEIGGPAVAEPPGGFVPLNDYFPPFSPKTRHRGETLICAGQEILSGFEAFHEPAG